MMVDRCPYCGLVPKEGWRHDPDQVVEADGVSRNDCDREINTASRGELQEALQWLRRHELPAWKAGVECLAHEKARLQRRCQQWRRSWGLLTQDFRDAVELARVTSLVTRGEP